MWIYALSLLHYDWLVLWNEHLHDGPADEVGNCADAEDNHVACWLALKAHELECGTLLLGVGEEVATGQVEVKEVFKISKVGTVAGAMVTDGKVHAKDKARLIRDGIVIFTGDINALKRYKDDAKEVATGLECGISLVNCNDIQAGDIIETFTEIEVEQKL